MQKALYFLALVAVSSTAHAGFMGESGLPDRTFPWIAGLVELIVKWSLVWAG